MGNAISNASEVINPTYSTVFNNGQIDLIEKTNAEYDFQELRYRHKEVAINDLRSILISYKRHRLNKIEEASEEIRKLKASIMQYQEDIAAISLLDVDKEKKRLLDKNYKPIVY